jgi:subtilase family serine protease
MFWTDFTSRPAAAALNSWLAGAPASLNHDHELIFAVPQMNLDVLEQKLQQVSDPRSDVYGHHLSFKEVGALIRNAPSFNTVSAWLASSGAQCRATPHGEYLHCTAPVSLWNTLLNTQFRHFSHASHAGTPVVRALNVSVPSAMAPHLAAIHLASAFGLPVRASSCAPPRRVASGDPFCDTHPCATVPTLQNVYNTCGARPNKSAALGPGFNAAGRGYPDVALIGHLYPIYVGGDVNIKDGTSASTPVMGAIVALANAKRLAAGKPPVGFANPALYGWAGSNIFHDVTSGANNCCAGGWGPPLTCCPSNGFRATAGWDAATGLGSVNAGRLVEAWAALAL